MAGLAGGWLVHRDPRQRGEVMALRFAVHAGPIPKPEKARKARRWIQRSGKLGDGWESFKQSVFFPRYFFRFVDQFNRAMKYDGYVAGNTIPIKCNVEGCPAVGTLTLLEKPNERGHFWHCEGMQVDHIQPRAHEPGMRYELANCRWLCESHNKEKGGKHD